MRFNKGWVIFVVLLVLSITPVSANQMRDDVSNEIRNTDKKVQESTNGVVQHGYNMKDYIISIFYCLIDILTCNYFIIENCWKWWKISQIWDHICQIALNIWHINEYIDNTVSEVPKSLISTLLLFYTFICTLFTVNKLSEKLDNCSKIDLCFVSGIVQNGTIINNVNNSPAIAVEDIPIDGLQLGDVVVYESKGMFNRALQFIKIENEMVFLEGSYCKNITLSYSDFQKSYKGLIMKGDPQHIKKSARKVNEIYQYQYHDIQDRKTHNQQNQRETTDSLNLYITLTIVFSLLAIILLIITIYAYTQKCRLDANPRLLVFLGGLIGGYPMSWVQLDAPDVITPVWEDFPGELQYIGPSERDPVYYQEYNNPHDYPIRRTEPRSTSFYVSVSIITGILTFLCVVGTGITAYLWSVQDNILSELKDDANNLNFELADLEEWAVTKGLTPPVAVCLNFTTHEGCPVNDTLNGTDIYDSPLGYLIDIKPLHGSITQGNEGDFVYKSKPGFVGTDNFTYNVQDLDLGLLSLNSGWVNIVVNPDQAPIANNMTLFTATNTSLNGCLDGTDPDNDTLHYTTASDPLYGSLKLGDDGFYVYTPADNFTGNDSFTYQTTDNVLNSTVGNVTVCVVNGTIPIAYNMIFNIAQNSILHNKFNITGIKDTKKIFNILSTPLHGILNVSDENFTYTPTENYYGQDIIAYNFTDVLKQTSNLATLNIFIRSPPTADNIKLSTKLNTLIEYNFKVKGYNSEPKLLSLPQHGTLKLLENQKFTYTPYMGYHGTDTFTYQAEDSLGQKSPTKTITITTTKPSIRQTKPNNTKNIINKQKDSTNINNPYKNLVNGLVLPDLNITATYMNMSNINFTNPTEQMTNPIITFIKQIINHIKNILNQIKL